MKFSQKGEKILKEAEGFIAHVKPDRAGNPTIGYGHKVKAGEYFSIISPEEGERILRADVAPIEALINNYLPRVTQNQFDALVIFIFNIGATAFLNSGVFSNLKDKKFEEATKPWAKWIHITEKVKDPHTGEIIKKLVPIAGLMNRRAIELKLFNT